MSSKTLAMVSAAASLVACSRAALGAQKPPSATQKEAIAIVERWQADLRDAEVALTQGKARLAHDRADRVLRDITERVIEPGNIQIQLALAMALRALAAVELGDEEQGIWDWQIATQLFPRIKELDVSAHGRAGEVLLANPAPEPPDPRHEDGEPTDPDAAHFHVVAPRKLSTPRPHFPRAKLGSAKVSVTVQVIIGTDGKMHMPGIVESSGEPTLLVLTFDRLRDWRFKPAMLNGEPIAVYYNLTVNFVSR